MSDALRKAARELLTVADTIRRAHYMHWPGDENYKLTAAINKARTACDWSEAALAPEPAEPTQEQVRAAFEQWCRRDGSPGAASSEWYYHIWKNAYAEGRASKEQS